MKSQFLNNSIHIIHENEMGKFEKEELKKRKVVKNSWFDWLINYVPNPTKMLLAILKITF